MTSSQTDVELRQLEVELGHARVENLVRDLASEDVATLLAEFRGMFIEAARDGGVGVRELARRLDISPASVSRTLNSSSDMRISTIALLANAIESYWHIELKKKHVGVNQGERAANFFQTTSATDDPRLLAEALRNSALTNAVDRNNELESQAFEYA